MLAVQDRRRVAPGFGPSLNAVLLGGALALLPSPGAAQVAQAGLEEEVRPTSDPRRAVRTRRGRGPAGEAAPSARSQNQVGDPGARPPRSTPESGVRIGERGIALVSEDRSVKLRIGGRLHLDANHFSANPAFDGTGERILIRRGWIETYLNLSDTWEAGLQLETANRVQPVLDAAIGYRGMTPFIVTVGNFREPFSLQQMSNVNQDTFVERAAADALSPARSMGVAVGANGERWSAVAGAFFGNINRGVEIGGRAGTARATYAPHLDGTDVLHLGISGSYRGFDRDDRVTALAPANVTDAIGAALITTRTIAGASSLARFGLEAALQLGPLRLQGEYIRTEVARDLLPAGIGGAAGRSLSFDGAYIQAALPLNGPPRAYRIAPNYGTHYGIFGDMTLPDETRLTRGGLGVFELAARYATLNLTDVPTGGGFERSWTLGLNWRPEPNVKVLANYTRFDVERPASGGGDATIDLTELRLQYYW